VRYCATPFGFVHACGEGGGPFDHECCADADCAGPFGARCVAFQVGYCGGAAPPEQNVCRANACATDADCGAGRACAPAGFRGLVAATCVERACATGADCGARPGGECRPLGGGAACVPLAGFYCTYADDTCRTDADCGAGGLPSSCAFVGDRTRCVGTPLPP
jgi:hypothetical protein